MKEQLCRIAGFYGIMEFYFPPKSDSSIPPNFEPQPGSREAELESLRLNYTYVNGVSEQHLNTIKELVAVEEARHTSIEAKIANVITQAGLVFSITAIVAPFFNDTLNAQNILVKIVVSIIFFMSFSAYLNSIIFATQIFGINKFIYRMTDPASVLDSGESSEIIIAKRVRDLIYQNRENREVNNRKASILIFANRWFITGFILSGLLIGVITASLLFIQKPSDELLKQNQLLTGLDNRLKNAESRITMQQFALVKSTDSLLQSRVDRSLNANKAELDSIRLELSKIRAHITK